MTYIFLIAAFNALFFTVLILQKQKALHDKILIFWLVYLGMYTGIYGLSFDKLFTDYHFLSAGFISLLLLHGPFLYLYISALTNVNFRIRRKNLLHFLPFVLFNIYIISAFLFPETTGKINLAHNNLNDNSPVLFNIFLILTVLSGPVYFIASISLFNKLDINIFNNFSASEKINPDWLRKLVYSFGVLWSILMIFTTVHHVFHLFDRLFCTHGIFFSLSVFIIIIGYYGLKQKEIFIQYPDRHIEYITGPAVKYTGSTLKTEEAEVYAEKIKSYMTGSKPYLDADLTLDDLAEKLGIPNYHLSRIINEKFGQNFFTFINHYRIDEIKARIANPQFNHLSLLGIAFDCGFNSKSAFNRVFKKITGTTPGEFKQLL